MVYFKTDVKFTNGRADFRTNGWIIGQNGEKIYTPRPIPFDWGVVKLILDQIEVKIKIIHKIACIPFCDLL